MANEWLTGEEIMLKYTMLGFELVDLCLKKILTPHKFFWSQYLPIDTIIYKEGYSVQAKYNMPGYEDKTFSDDIRELMFKRDEVIAYSKIRYNIDELPNPTLHEAGSAQVQNTKVTESQAEKWRRAAKQLQGPLKDTALLAAEKWCGQTHEAAFHAVFSFSVLNPRTAVSKRLRRVDKIIKAFPNLGLKRPPKRSY
ncbi:MAG: hypothetical protein LBR82_08870 [Desulfovibrio sp.]|jgi:hypothetical protein|nr:hypothetical protein [Desulfovibrio sp.]